MTTETFTVFGINFKIKIFEDRTIWIMSVYRSKLWKICPLAFPATFFDRLGYCYFAFSTFFDWLGSYYFFIFDFSDWLGSFGDLDLGFLHLLDGFSLSGLRPFWELTASFSGLYFFLISLFGFFNDGVLNKVLSTLLSTLLWFLRLCFLINFFFLSLLLLLWIGFRFHRFHFLIFQITLKIFIFWYRLWSRRFFLSLFLWWIGFLILFVLLKWSLKILKKLLF